MSTPEQHYVARVGTLNEGDGSCMSADGAFSLIMAACLIVDAALVRLVIAICDRFMLPLFPFVIAGLFAVIVVPFSIGSRLRAITAQLHEFPPSTASSRRTA